MKPKQVKKIKDLYDRLVVIDSEITTINKIGAILSQENNPIEISFSINKKESDKIDEKKDSGYSSFDGIMPYIMNYGNPPRFDDRSKEKDVYTYMVNEVDSLYIISTLLKAKLRERSCIVESIKKLQLVSTR